MESLSLPYRIALVAILAFGALYLTVLKGGGDQEESFAPPPVAGQTAPAPASASSPASSTPSAPGVKGLSSAVDKAKGAAATSTTANAAVQSADPEAPAAATTVAATAPASGGTTVAATAKPTATAKAPKARPAKAAASKPASGDPSRRILAGLKRGRTEVVLFTTRSAADDLAVRSAVGRVARRGGKVGVHVVPLSQVGRYEAITSGVTIRQSPTVVVIGKGRVARTIVGFTTTQEIDQLVADVRAGR